MTWWWPRLPWSHLATDWGSPFPPPEPDALPCTPPTLVEFRARFPEFVNYPDAAVTTAITDASTWADDSWVPGDCYKAISYLAAHFLVLRAVAAQAIPQPTPGAAGGVSFLPGGEVTSIGFDTMRVSFAAPKLAATSGQGPLDAEGIYDLESTPYGQRYLELLTVNKPAILIV